MRIVSTWSGRLNGARNIFALVVIAAVFAFRSRIAWRRWQRRRSLRSRSDEGGRGQMQKDEDTRETGARRVRKAADDKDGGTQLLRDVRGGHLDFCVLGAFQVSAQGDLANWHTGAPDAIPAVGGAMDLAIGAKKVFVMMDHQTKGGESKIVAKCTYPLTSIACVNRIYTDLAVIDVTPQGLRVLEMVDGLSLPELATLTGVPLAMAQA